MQGTKSGLYRIVNKRRISVQLLNCNMIANLPILEVLPQIKNTLLNHPILIVQAPPGAGKSTLLPLELLKEEWLKGNKILMLEPRKLAARSVATRMASLLNEEIGQSVGYRVRFENKVSKDTKLEVLTEGILTRILQHDNALEGVGLVIFDEFHERSLHADLALALCLEIQQVLREDLKIIIMSATLDGALLSKMLGNAPIITSEGRQHHISYSYLGNDSSPIHVRMADAIKRALKEQEGDILAFFPGAAEIHRSVDSLQSSVNSEQGTSSFELSTLNVELFPLYGDLSFKEQQAAILPHPQGKRKVVLATSIAETSLTIEGIKVVIDSGFARVPKFEISSGLTRLETVKVTADAAKQRAGRAGRLGPGVCYRLWSEATQLQLIENRTPEILEADLAPLLLEITNWGVANYKELTWITQPPIAAMAQANDLLQQLGAIKENKITDRGKEMLRLPTHPRISHLLLEGEKVGLSSLAIDVAAVLEERDPLSKSESANLALRIEELHKWRKKEHFTAEKSILERIDRTSLQISNLLQKVLGNNQRFSTDYSFYHEQVGRLIAAAYPERIAKQRENDLKRYRLANGRIVKLASDYDALDREKWLAIAHLDAGTSNEGRIFLAAPLNIEHLSHLYHSTETIRWDSQKGILITQKELRLGDSIVKTSALENVSESKRNEVLYQTIRSEGISILPWTDETIAWRNRLLWLAEINTEESLPDFTDGALLDSLEDWLFPLDNIKKRDDFKKLNLLDCLKARLTWEQTQRIDQLAPEAIKVPSGFTVPLAYFSDGRNPVLAVRLQEMFGLTDTPTINEGKTQVLLHLLSPGYKPVQVTQDLRSFWKNTYPDVRKELRIRYQKHHWPEDPWTAEAVRGVKRNLTR